MYDSSDETRPPEICVPSHPASPAHLEASPTYTEFPGAVGGLEKPPLFNDIFGPPEDSYNYDNPTTNL